MALLALPAPIESKHQPTSRRRRQSQTAATPLHADEAQRLAAAKVERTARWVADMQAFAQLARQEVVSTTSPAPFNDSSPWLGDFGLRVSAPPTTAPAVPQWDVGHEVAIAQRLPLATDARTTSTRASDGGLGGRHHAINHTLDSIRRAELGLVRIRPNPKDVERTAWLANITTRAGLMEIIEKQMRQVSASYLTPSYMSTRHSYLSGYEDFMRTGYHVSPWRYTWNTALTPQQLIREERWQMGYAHFNRLRFKTVSAVCQAATHVKQFHLVDLQIVQPDFPLLRNLLRLMRHAARKDSKGHTRNRRPSLKPKHIRALCALCDSRSEAAATLQDSVMWAVLACIMSFAFQFLYRIGELACGAAFHPDAYFTIDWLAPLLLLAPGENCAMFHGHRKVDNEWTREQFPVLYEDVVGNFVRQYHRLRAIFTPAASASAFSFADGSVPTASWVCECTKLLMKQLFPAAAAAFDYTNHCFRRGGAALLAFLKVDPRLQEQLGCWTADSESRILYMARVRASLVAVQKGMLTHDFEIMQDDFVVSEGGHRGPLATTAAPQPAPPPPPPAAETALPSPMDTDLDSVVSDDTDDAVAEMAALDLDDEGDGPDDAALAGALTAAPSESEARAASSARPPPTQLPPAKRAKPGRRSDLAIGLSKAGASQHGAINRYFGNMTVT